MKRPKENLRGEPRRRPCSGKKSTGGHWGGGSKTETSYRVTVGEWERPTGGFTGDDCTDSSRGVEGFYLRGQSVTFSSRH